MAWVTIAKNTFTHRGCPLVTDFDKVSGPSQERAGTKWCFRRHAELGLNEEPWPPFTDGGSRVIG